jgi:predicted RNA-binding Zn-ribbon protein involved in translation (DUF1610 family)
LPVFKGLADVLRKVKFSPPKPVFCPRCRSPKIMRLQTFGILPVLYRCKECDYNGTLVLELELED